MSRDLRQELKAALQGRVCCVGVGNVTLGDDALGVRLAEALKTAGVANVVVAETTPENWAGKLAAQGFDHVVFLDAVELGAEPGAVAFLKSDEIEGRFPQVSTHKLSLGLVARLIMAESKTRVWLLGVQPQSLREGAGLAQPVQSAVEALEELLVEVLGGCACAHLSENQ